MTSDQTWGCPSEINNAADSWSWILPSSSSAFCPTTPINSANQQRSSLFSSGFGSPGTPVTVASPPSFSSGFAPFAQSFSSGFARFGTPVTVAPPQSFSSGFHSTSQKKHTQARSNTYGYYEEEEEEEERVSVNSLMSKSPVKEEEAKGADSQHEIRVPDEMKHKTVKRETIKNSPLPMILISRILKGIPQNPHFLELRRCSVTSRANLEGAWDRTFEETVEQIHALRASEFWVGAGRIWKSMEELERLGYNVLVLRKRVVELSDVMVKRNKRQNEIIVLKVRAEVHRMEKSRVESVIRNLRAEAQGEQDKMVENLIEAADKEKDLPQLENELANLATVPLEV